MFSLLFFACTSSEYEYDFHAPKNEMGIEGVSYAEQYDYFSTKVIDYSEIPSDIREVISPDDVNIFIDSALQRNQWGHNVSRCQIQVAFSRQHLMPPTTEPVNPPIEPPPLPEEPGECIFTGMVELPPIENHDPNQTPPDNWFVSGPLVGPDSIYLHGEQTIELEAIISEDGQIRYEWRDCDPENFPFGEVFDLEIPEGESSMAAMITEQGELEPVWLENALIVGADLRLEFPNEIDANHYYTGFSDEDFTVQWSNYGNFPHQNEVFADYTEEEISPLEPKFEIKFTNNKKHEWFAGEQMNCMPNQNYDDTIPSENIAQFQLNDMVGEDTFYLALDVHSNYLGPKINHPFGEAVHSRSHISEGGLMLIVKAGEELASQE